jgi:hypothetical protein
MLTKQPPKQTAQNRPQLPQQVVVDALYRPDGGHECLRETVQAVVAGVRNPGHLELSISAVQLLQRCGDRLAVWEETGHRDAAPARAVANAPGGVDLGARGGGGGGLRQHPCQARALPTLATLLLLGAAVRRHLSTLPTTHSAPPPAHPQPFADGDYGWGLLLRTLSDVLQHDRRPQVGEASLDVLFALLSQHSSHWDDAAWRVMLQRVVRHMLALPPSLAGDDGRGSAASEAAAAQQLARAEEDGLVLAMLRRMDRYFPLLCEQIGLISEQYRVSALGLRLGGGCAWGWAAASCLAALPGQCGKQGLACLHHSGPGSRR